MLERWPDYAPAKFMLGQCLLQQDDEAGVPLLEEAMAQNPDLVLPSCDVIHEFLSAKGRNEEAAAYFKRALARHAMVEAAEHETRKFTKRDVFLPHDLSDEALEPVRAMLSAHAEIVEAYLVRKQLRTELGEPAYVLGLVPKLRGMTWSTASQNALGQILEDADLPVGMIVVLLLGDNAFLIKPMRKIPGALVYRKQR